MSLPPSIMSVAKVCRSWWTVNFSRFRRSNVYVGSVRACVRWRGDERWNGLRNLRLPSAGPLVVGPASCRSPCARLRRPQSPCSSSECALRRRASEGAHSWTIGFEGRGPHGSKPNPYPPEQGNVLFERLRPREKDLAPRPVTSAPPLPHRPAVAASNVTRVSEAVPRGFHVSSKTRRGSRGTRHGQLHSPNGPVALAA